MSENQKIAIAEIPHSDEYSPLIDDASRLLSSEAYDNHLSPDKVRDSIEGAHMVVAMNKIDGLIGAGVLRIMSSTSASISGVAITPERRRNGLGTEIIKRLEEIAAARQINRLTIVPSNEEAAKLYERLGYSEIHPDISGMQKTIGASELHGK